MFGGDRGALLARRGGPGPPQQRPRRAGPLRPSPKSPSGRRVNMRSAISLSRFTCPVNVTAPQNQPPSPLAAPTCALVGSHGHQPGCSARGRRGSAETSISSSCYGQMPGLVSPSPGQHGLVWSSGLSPVTCHLSLCRAAEEGAEARGAAPNAHRRSAAASLGPLAEQHVSCTPFLLGTPPHTHTQVRPASSDLSLARQRCPWPVFSSHVPRLREQRRTALGAPTRRVRPGAPRFPRTAPAPGAERRRRCGRMSWEG